ncbi:MAG: hypothetical protein E7000_09685 [Coriobacteriaceae bacterium]|nr:hypothetical protein [Coriobacteriaceae bacterium]
MQIAGKRVNAFVLTACLLVALVCGGAVAYAAGAWWTGGGNETLTVNAVGDSYDDAFKEDIANADVVIDYYKIATAEADETYQKFNYELTGDFAGQGFDIPAEADRSAETWQQLADECAALDAAKLTADGMAAPGTPITSLEDGLYLVMAHGKGITDSMTARTETHEYTFQPTIVALPNLEDNQWVTNVTIAMKPEQGDLYGDLRIVKRVEGYFGTPATFVFHLKSTEDSPFDYDNYASVEYSGGESAYTDVRHIKAGTKLTVTEEEGTGFELVSGDDSVKTIVAKAADADEDAVPEVTVTYVNKATGKPAHGIENNYKLVDDGEEGGEWEWHVADDANAEPGPMPTN